MKAVPVVAPVVRSISTGYLRRLVTTDIEPMHHVQREAFLATGFLLATRQAMGLTRQVTIE